MTDLPRVRPLLGVVTTALAAGLALGLAAGPAQADPEGRRLVDHTVRPGETVTELAVRYHAWTDEVISHNDLGPSALITAGQRLEIPVVLSALPERQARHRSERGDATNDARSKPWPRREPNPATQEPALVRRVVARVANRHGVDPQLALAVSWQESGWQMGLRSSAGAIGPMQVLPGTGAWMSLYEGRRLHLRRLHDNATAGVRLLDVLQAETSSTRRAVAAYYQGLGAVREHGIYPVSRPYVRNVLALRDRLEAGQPPAQRPGR